MRVVERTGPRAVLIENVPGFARKFGGLDWLRAAFHNVNAKLGTRYELSHAIIDAAEYGVPQRRRRLVAVADREGRQFIFPEALTNNSPRTAWDAVWDLEPADVTPLAVRGRWANLLRSIPAGENYLWHTDRGGGLRLFGYRTRYWSFLLKLSPQAPSWTLSAQPAQTAGPFHWENRRLSLSEMLRLQSFPKNWKVCGSYSDHVRQLGNAFPPLLAEILGRELRTQLLEAHSTASSPYTLWLPRAETPPPICDVEGVADEYLSLVDAHPAHPGHGLGPGALRRAA
jgi:DNA (cytosine-5)-methyltransferase 1